MARGFAEVFAGWESFFTLTVMDNRDFGTALDMMRKAFRSGLTRSYTWRRGQLLALLRFLSECKKELSAAVFADLGKSEAETCLTEISFVAGEIRHALRHLRRWMRPACKGVPLHYLFGSAAVYPEPHGVVLIIGAWNYPLQLVLAPLVSALAAGNCAVLKPSESAPHTSALLARLAGIYLDRRAVSVVEGGVDETCALLEYRFDFIFYTGSRSGGREVMLAAARKIVPVALELGGKNPCIIDRDVNLGTAARRIVWAKFLNAGQTCLAPDYLLVHQDVEEGLLRYMYQAVIDFYGSDPALSPDYSRIVNDRHFTRLEQLVHGGNVVFGGQCDRASCYIAPTILRETGESPIMQEEIFGPLLPVLSYETIDQALAFIEERNNPLAVYLFSSCRATKNRVLHETRSGSFCCNDLLFQSAIHSLPFGGSGASGFGRYHGQAGFETFSSSRSVLFKTFFPDPGLRYPPYGPEKFSVLKSIVRFFG
ncbi:aldehyde dehydrogenase family protein [Chlorobium sp.]|uniref:aldehyde dehydrogenase family protein n=2 Tax=Chlorobium sp. TaxID=1095 RepID=UPI00344E6D17